MVAQEARGVLIVGNPRPKDDNPDTWVRTAWHSPAAGEMIESSQPPAGINETEWYILRRHVFLNEGFATIALSFSEPMSRVRSFAEDATRRIYPDAAIVAEAATRGGSLDTAGARAHADLMVNAGRLYRALGAPLGDSPEGQAAFFAWFADNAAMIQSVSDALRDNPIVTAKAEDSHTVIRIGSDATDVRLGSTGNA